MSVRTVLACATAAAVALAAGPAVSQDFHQAPTYGTRAVQTGFQPDPIRVSLQSGGSIDATRLGGDCKGMIASAPDYRINYTAGTSLPLILSVASSTDTTLVVNGPDGRWYCNDDGPNGINPSVRFNHPTSGQYDVWVGTYGGSGLHAATLAISELTSQ